MTTMLLIDIEDPASDQEEAAVCIACGKELRIYRRSPDECESMFLYRVASDHAGSCKYSEPIFNNESRWGSDPGAPGQPSPHELLDVPSPGSGLAIGKTHVPTFEPESDCDEDSYICSICEYETSDAYCCNYCSNYVCDDHTAYCELCDQSYCDNHASCCSECDTWFCKTCLDEHCLDAHPDEDENEDEPGVTKTYSTDVPSDWDVRCVNCGKKYANHFGKGCMVGAKAGWKYIVSSTISTTSSNTSATITPATITIEDSNATATIAEIN